jgi:tetratricopeptide (TPR) repeat protein
VAREDARRIDVEALGSDDSLDLLSRIIGSRLVEREPEAARKLVNYCARLPLALRIAADRAAAHPHRSLSHFADELAAEHDRMDILAVDDDDASTVRTVFSWSYNALPPQAQRMFRLLGVHAGADISLSAAAALADTTEGDARRLLETLIHAHLVEEHHEQRYRSHDLLRAYAAGRAEADETDLERDQALLRLLRWHLHHADQAGRAFGTARKILLDGEEKASRAPAFRDHHEALAWCEAERDNIVIATQQAARSGHHQLAWKVAASLRSYFHLRRIWTDWVTTHETALRSAQLVNDLQGQAVILNGLGVAHTSFRRFDDARRYFSEGMQLSRQLQDPYGEALALSCLGDVHWSTHEFHNGLAHLHDALGIWTRLNDQWGIAITRRGLGRTYRDSNQPEEALDHLNRALDIYTAISDRWGEGSVLADTGRTFVLMNRHLEAINALSDAADIHRELGNLWQEAKTLHTLSEALRMNGQARSAQEAQNRANAIFEELPLLPGSGENPHEKS